VVAWRTSPDPAGSGEAIVGPVLIRTSVIRRNKANGNRAITFSSRACQRT
jgi:hypothetical protein